MERENVAYRTVEGCGNSRRLSELDHCTAEPINFQSVTTLQDVIGLFPQNSPR
jgi:hypothetical protein